MSLLKHLEPEKSQEKTETNKNRLHFHEICVLYEELVSISSTLEKESLLANFITQSKTSYPVEDLRIFYQLTAKDFSHLTIEEETGVSTGIFIQALSSLLGMSKDEIKFHNKGDWGETTYNLFKKRSKKGNKVLASTVLESIYALPKLSGKGSQLRKISVLLGLLKKFNQVEAKYYSRLIMGGSLKIGVQDKLIQKSFFTAFPEIQPYQDDIDYSIKVRQLNFGYAVEWFLAGHLKNKLSDLTMKPGFPIKLMLADRGTIDIVESEIHFVEEKYDGYRIQAHVEGEKVWVFSRQLTDQTAVLPDIIKELKVCCTVESAIFDGEVIAYDLKSGAVLPFQTIITRKRKHDSAKVASKMRTEYRIFDLIFVNGEDMTSKALENRRSILESVITENSVIKLSQKLVTNNPEEALEYADQAKKNGHEGIMIKPVTSRYHIGKRDKAWIKIKPEIYDLDGIVVGGQYGTGKRQGLISRLFVAFPTSKNNGDLKYECLGVAVGSGISEAEMSYFKDLFESQGEDLKPESILSDESNTPDLWLDPEFNIVIEVVADSFSWRTSDGSPISIDNIPENKAGDIDLTKISLRFPRFKNRREKGKEPNTKDDIIKMIKINISGRS